MMDHEFSFWRMALKAPYVVEYAVNYLIALPNNLCPYSLTYQLI